MQCLHLGLSSRVQPRQDVHTRRAPVMQQPLTHLLVPVPIPQGKKTRAQFNNWLCYEETQVCKYKPPPLPKVRQSSSVMAQPPPGCAFCGL